MNLVEVVGWFTGAGPWEPGTVPPLWITITVPDAWRGETAGQMIALVRRAVRRVDDARGWRRTGGDLWVDVVGIAGGSVGLDGTAATADDIVSYMTEKFRARLEAGEVEVPAGGAVDPMCGMVVRPGPRAVTLGHDGGTVAYCARACRDAYARRHGLSVPI